MPAEKVEELKKEAMINLHCAMNLYKNRSLAGRHVLRQHPPGATTLNDAWIKILLNLSTISAVVSDQCENGLLTPDANGIPTHAKKTYSLNKFIPTHAQNTLK